MVTDNNPESSIEPKKSPKAPRKKAVRKDPQKSTVRDVRFNIRLTKAEEALVKSVANTEGRTASDWARLVILKEAHEWNMNRKRTLSPAEIRMLPNCGACGHPYLSHGLGEMIGARCEDCASEGDPNWIHEYVVPQEGS